VIIDELFRPELSPTNLEIQQFMRSLHFSLLLQRAPLEAMVNAAGLSLLAWVVLSERYHVHTRSDEECDRLLHAYRRDGVHQGYIGGVLLEKFYNRGCVDYVLLALHCHVLPIAEASQRGSRGSLWSNVWSVRTLARIFRV
jgi:hypothetical protein